MNWSPADAAANRSHSAVEEQDGQETPELYMLQTRAEVSYCTSIKVSVAVTQTSKFIVDTMALPGNPFDRHTLHQALAQVRTLTGASVEEAYVDRGYRGHSETQTQACPLGQRRGVNPQF